jgi:hypothetical protein
MPRFAARAAAPVKGPTYVVKRGKKPVLSVEDTGSFWTRFRRIPCKGCVTEP